MLSCLGTAGAKDKGSWCWQHNGHNAKTKAKGDSVKIFTICRRRFSGNGFRSVRTSAHEHKHNRRRTTDMCSTCYLRATYCSQHQVIVVYLRAHPRCQGHTSSLRWLGRQKKNWFICQGRWENSFQVISPHLLLLVLTRAQKHCHVKLKFMANLCAWT